MLPTLTDVRSTMLPRSFGGYVLFDFVGKGGMAEIYLAKQKMQLGGARLCVVKQILPALAGDPKFSEMLVHEAKLAARLSHANVVEVFDLGREDERLFIAMEYVEGFDLNDLLGRCSRAKEPLPFELAVHVIREALRGLDYAHRRKADDGTPLGIVHRDVSPSNLLLSFDGGVKVCDFGIAHANDTIAVGSATHEFDEALRGKAGYMSPEHARGDPVDARADVFAAGIILWELVAGRRMYRATENMRGLLEQARRAEMPELPRHDRPHEEALHGVILKALAPDRDRRYASAGAMLRDLDDYVTRARLMTSALQLGNWLTTTFGEDVIARRRSRERAVVALEKGAPLVMELLARVPPAPSSSDVFAGLDFAPPKVLELVDDGAEREEVAPDTKRRTRRASAIAIVAVALATIVVILLVNAFR